MASFYISAQDPEKALQFLQQSVALWYREPTDDDDEPIDVEQLAREVDEELQQDHGPAVNAPCLYIKVSIIIQQQESGMNVDAVDDATGHGDNDDDEYEDIDDDADVQCEPPPYEARIAAAKLLIELGDYQVPPLPCAWCRH
jgi:hypothetical protein